MHYGNETMISAYGVILVVVGMVLSYLGLIHHFWLRSIFRAGPEASATTIIKVHNQPLRMRSTQTKCGDEHNASIRLSL